MRDGSLAPPAISPPGAGLGDLWLTELDPDGDSAFFADWLTRQCAATTWIVPIMPPSSCSRT